MLPFWSLLKDLKLSRKLPMIEVLIQYQRTTSAIEMNGDDPTCTLPLVGLRCLRLRSFPFFTARILLPLRPLILDDCFQEIGLLGLWSASLRQQRVLQPVVCDYLDAFPFLCLSHCSEIVFRNLPSNMNQEIYLRRRSSCMLPWW